MPSFDPVRSALSRLFQTQGNHETRLRNLERNLSGAGWRFNKNLQGGWGYLVANDSTDIDYGTLGLLFVDKSGAGIAFLCDPAGAQMGVQIQPDFTSIGSPAGGPVFTVADTGIVGVLLRATNKLQVRNHLNAPIFEVREDGSVHIETGGTIVADL